MKASLVPGTAKARLVSTLEEIRRMVERLPEPACALLEQAAVLNTVRRHIGTFGEATAVLSPLSDAVRSIRQAVTATQRRTATARRTRA